MMIINIISFVWITITGSVTYGENLFNLKNGLVRIDATGAMHSKGHVYGYKQDGTLAYHLGSVGNVVAWEALQIAGDRQVQIEKLTHPQADGGITITAWSDDGSESEYVQWNKDTDYWSWPSDRRLKTDIIDETNVLPRIMAVPLRNYSWKSEGDINIRTIGFIAQEVQPHFPHLVGAAQVNEEDTEYLTLGNRLGDLAFAGVRELKLEKDRELEMLLNKIEILTNEVELLKKQTNQIP